MGKIEHVNKAAIKGAVSQALSGKRQRHRLCFDFNEISGVKAFFDKCKKSGITHPDSVPVLLHQDGDETVWLVGFKKPSSIIETLDV